MNRINTILTSAIGVMGVGYSEELASVTPEQIENIVGLSLQVLIALATLWKLIFPNNKKNNQKLQLLKKQQEKENNFL